MPSLAPTGGSVRSAVASGLRPTTSVLGEMPRGRWIVVSGEGPEAGPVGLGSRSGARSVQDPRQAAGDSGDRDPDRIRRRGRRLPQDP